jgi:ubiquinol-cytochrome c reductase cytochrome c subunit
VRRARALLRRLRVPVAVVCGGLALVNLAAPAPAPSPVSASSAAAAQDDPLVDPGGSVVRDPVLVREGRRLFVDTCSSCHGEDARGLPARGPSLRGVGELAADFYLRTNRMPLDDPQDQPSRHPSSPLSVAQKRALVVYIGSFGGPPVPRTDPASADVGEGRRLFAESCAGCHQVVARGGTVPRGRVPDLEGVAPIDVAEAVAIGPYVMPVFGHLEDRQVDAIARYVAYAQDPEDRGGWGIGHIGPIPEGMVTWFLAAAALLLTIRVIGERTTQ